MGGKANTFLARVSELRIGIYIRACVAKINIKSKRKMRNGKWEMGNSFSGDLPKKNKKKI